jgi:hypothetical protein
VAATIGVAVGAFLPWGFSGKADRSGFELARTAERLDLVDTPILRLMVNAVAVLPLLAAAAWTAAALGWSRWVATLAGVTGAMALAATVVVWKTPLRPAVGLWVVAGAGGVGVLSAGVLVVRGRMGDRPQRPTDGAADRPAVR